MRKTQHYLWKQRLVKGTIFTTAILVAAIMLGSAISAGIARQSTTTQPTKNTVTYPEGLRVDGPAPHTLTKNLMTSGISAQGSPQFDSRGYFYAYNAYDPYGTQMGPITFDIPSVIDLLAPGIAPNFISGADIDAEGDWYGVDYNGGLYAIGFDGTMTFIANTIPLNGLVYDSTTGVWYATGGGNELYILDIVTGATTLIGPHNLYDIIIGLACDNDGNMYGYDVLWTGTSTLYSIDKDTGAATAIGPMGEGFIYAQDPAYDRDEEILYIAGYTQAGTSGLYTCDTTSGAVTLIDYFENFMEVDGFAIPWMPVQYDHDVAVTGITQPTTGPAQTIIPSVKVKNKGLFDEVNIPVNFKIGKKLISGPTEDFETSNGGYTHYANTLDAWEYGVPTSGPLAAHSGTKVWATTLAGNYPAAMWCGLISSPFLVLYEASVEFWHWYDFETNWDGGNVKISIDNGATWELITPAGGYPGAFPSAMSPYMSGQPCFTGSSGQWVKAAFNIGDYEGETALLKWETASDSYVEHAGWYIDDVSILGVTWPNVYNHTVSTNLLVGETKELTFPAWAPSDLFLVENTDIIYGAEAQTFLAGDQNTDNDYKIKQFALHYPFFHDVAITSILSPEDGYATIITPEVELANLGQYDENVDVTMVIEKAAYTTLLEEDFSTSVPPPGWGTNYPQNWMSSSTNYAGGTAPEAMFSWSPSSVDEHRLYTGPIDTTGYTSMILSFKEYVNDFNSLYTLKIETSTDGGATWGTVYSRPGGPFGPTTTSMEITTAHGMGSPALQIAWTLSGDSYNINYWYIDDVWMGLVNYAPEYSGIATTDVNAGSTVNVSLPDWTPSDVTFGFDIDYRCTATAIINDVTFNSGTIPDGDPSNNVLVQWVTLTYIHDTGVTEITAPTYPYLRGEGDIIFHQRPFTPTESWTFRTSSTGGGYLCQDDFWALTEPIGDIEFWGLALIYSGGWFQGNPAGMEFEIIFYENGGTAPGAPVATFSGLTPTAVNTGLQYSGFNMFYWALDLPENVELAEGWVSIQSTACPDGSWLLWAGSPEGNLNMWQQGGSPPQIAGDSAYNLSAGASGPGGNWPPGTYGVSGVAKNLGSFTETNILVNAKIWKQDTKTDILYYEENVTVATLAPGAETPVTFPDVTFVDADEGYFKLEMRTMLPGDDRPSNDKKSMNFVIQAPDVTPPVTTHELTGTMGLDDWYVSTVTVTLTAVDPPAGFTRGMGKWPTGVNHTYYKIDTGAWEEYTTPFAVTADGTHTVSYYSDDNAGNVETTKEVSFKMDTTAPTITLTATAQNILKTKWLLEATVSDATSGVVKVEFYVDDAYVGEATAAPWEYLYQGTGKVAQAIAYDEAGNSAMSDPVDSLGITELNTQATTLPVLQTLRQQL